jgi:hypothetical protein
MARLPLELGSWDRWQVRQLETNSAISVQLRQKMLKDFEILGLQSRSFIW